MGRKPYKPKPPPPHKTVLYWIRATAQVMENPDIPLDEDQLTRLRRAVELTGPGKPFELRFHAKEFINAACRRWLLKEPGKLKDLPLHRGENGLL